MKDFINEIESKIFSNVKESTNDKLYFHLECLEKIIKIKILYAEFEKKSIRF